METLEGLLQRIRSCDVCKADLPLGPRPIVRASSSAKLLIIGNSGVGKTCILKQFVDDEFLETHLTTIGVDFMSKIIPIDNTRINL